MSFRFLASNLIAISLVLGLESVSAASSGTTYVLTITNGGAMPVSPGVVYALAGQKSTTEVGTEPTQGLVQLCQTGNPIAKIAELKANSKITTLASTKGPVFPGQTVSVEITVKHPGVESLHFIAMYGKTKEACSSIDIQSHVLRSLFRDYDEAGGTDKVISAGAFTEPALGASPESVCAGAADAVTCLRDLSTERAGTKQIHYFAGYLPSLLTFLEGKYGSDDALSLIVPTSGAVSYSLTRK